MSALCLPRNESATPGQPQAKSQIAGACILRSFRMPFYPTVARELGLQGKTTAVLHIAPDGTVISVTDVISHPLFHTAVVDPLKEWRFEPSEVQERELKVEFTFALKGDRDEKCLNYRVSGTMPSHFEIETNPFPNVYS